MHCLRVLWLKNRSTKSYFSRLQIKSQKWFISIYFLQILTKPCRTPLKRELFSLNASWFPYARTQKKKHNFWEKLARKNIDKTFIENNNNKIIRTWYLSSKWPVCRSIVNQTTGEKSRTKLSTFFNTNIFKYCALFCNKIAKIPLQ